jgi:hypothetical protein
MVPYTPTAYTECYFPLSDSLSDLSGKGHVIECYNGDPIFETVTGRPGCKVGTRNNLVLVAQDSCGMGIGDSTFMFWVYCSALPLAGYPYQLADITIGPSGLNFNISYFNNSNTEYNLQFERFLGQSSNDFVYPHTIDTYHHIAVTVVSGVSVTYYLNGVSIYTAAPVGVAGQISTLTNSSFGDIDTNTYTQAAILSEIVVESRALSSTQIFDIYTDGI